MHRSDQEPSLRGSLPRVGVTGPRGDRAREGHLPFRDPPTPFFFFFFLSGESYSRAEYSSVREYFSTDETILQRFNESILLFLRTRLWTGLLRCASLLHPIEIISAAQRARGTVNARVLFGDGETGPYGSEDLSGYGG